MCLELGCVLHSKPLMGQQPGEGGSAQDLGLKVGLWDQVTVPQGGRHLLLHLHQQQNRHCWFSKQEGSSGWRLGRFAGGTDNEELWGPQGLLMVDVASWVNKALCRCVCDLMLFHKIFIIPF